MSRNITCVSKHSNTVVDQRFCKKNFSEDTVESEMMEKEVTDLTTTASCYVSCHHDCTVSEWSQWSHCHHEDCLPQTTSKRFFIIFWSVLSPHFYFSWWEKTQETHCSGSKGSPWKMLSPPHGDRVTLRTALWFNFHKYSFQAVSCLSVLSIPVGGERWRCFLPAVGWPQGWK